MKEDLAASTLERFERALAEFRPEAHDAGILQQAAAAWALRAQNEHASVAAFDRFSLGLMAVAAPPELLEASHHAALDEILHARLSFALASAYGGRAVGPGPLEITAALDAVSNLRELVVATITEGCIGETLSAMEVRGAIAGTTENAARIALEVIATDEERHAELAWSFVRWALAQDPELGSLVHTTFERALGQAASAGDDAARVEDVTSYGFLSSSARLELRAAAVRDVLRPATRALHS